MPCSRSACKQRQIDFFAGGSVLAAVLGDGGKLVLVDGLRVVQEASDQGALAVVHAAAGQQTQQLLALVLRQVLVDVCGGRFRLLRHRFMPGCFARSF
jgi:hypothetical protein